MRIEASSTHGDFWLPSNPDKRVHGTLQIEPGGRIRLELRGALVELSFDSYTAPQIPRICGRVDKLGFVTLEDTACISRSGTPFRTTKATFSVNFAFLGHAFLEAETPRFDALFFHLDNLDQWHRITGIKVLSDQQHIQTSVTYTRPSPVPLWQAGNFSVSIEFGWKPPALPAVSVATVEQRSYLVVRSSTPTSLDELLGVAFRLRNFVSFAVGQNVCMSDVSLQSNAITEPTSGEKKFPKEIRPVFREVRHQEAVAKIDRFEVLIPFDHLKGRSQSVIRAWMDLQEKATPAINLFLSALADEHTYMNFRYLSLAQSLESLHHRVVHPKGMYLAKRLAAQIRPFEKHFGDEAARKDLIRRIVETRNYFTHYDEKHSALACHNYDLWVLCEKATLLFVFVVLDLVGVTPTEIDALIAERPRILEKLKLQFTTPLPSKPTHG